MAINCGNLIHQFDASKDQGQLLSIVGPLLKLKGATPNKVYSELKRGLINQNVFQFGTNTVKSKQLESYKNSINELYNEIKKLNKIVLSWMSKEDLDAFNNLLEENLFEDAGLISDSIIKVEKPQELEIEGFDQKSEDERNSLTLEDAFRKIYGSCLNAKQQREDEFDVAIINTTRINYSSRKIITTVEDLNESIGQYKNDQYKNIVKYLKSKDPNYNFSEEMFDENGFLTNDYYKVMNLFYNLLMEEKNLSDLIYEEWNKTSLKNEQSDFLNAVHAYVNLQYFDNLLKDRLSKFIELTNNKLFGQEVDLGYNKYVFGKSNEHKVTTWSTEDNKDSLKNVAKHSKMILKTIPIYSSLDNKFQNRYVNLQNFCTAVTHMFNAVRKSNLTDLNPLRKVLRKFHSNPYVYSKQLFKILSTGEDGKNILGEKLVGDDFTRMDLNILTSVYKQVYDTDNENSIIRIETDSLKKNFSIDTYSIIDSINGVIDRIMEANYLQVKFQDNGYDVSIKKKFASRKNAYSLANKINIKNSQNNYQKRKQLSKKYPISRPDNNYTRYIIKIGENTEINIKASDGILATKGISIKVNNDLYNSVFSASSTDIDFSYQTIKRIISGENLSEKEQLFRDTLNFIDTFLDLDLLSENGLNILNIYKLNLSNFKNYIEDILLSAIRAAAVNDFYKTFQEKENPGSKYLNPIKFEEFMSDEYFISSSGRMDKKTQHQNFYTNRFGTYLLNSVHVKEEWIDKFIFAESVFTGESNKSTTKDQFGNSIGNYRTSFLGGNIFYYIDKYNEDPENSAKSLMFSQQPNLIKDIVINQDVQSRFGDIKSVRNMKPAELFYTHIINNFYGSYVSSERNSLSKCFVIQPTVYSDKVTFVNYTIDADRQISLPDGVEKKEYHGKTLAQLSTNELIEYYNDTIGVAYKKTFDNILNDYRKLFNNPEMTLDEISLELKKYNENTLKDLINIAQQKGIELQEDTHYRIGRNGNLELNELLYHYSYVLHKDSESLKKRFKFEEIQFLNDLLDSGISFYTNYATDTVQENDEIRRNNLIRRIINNDKLFSQNQIADIKTKWIKNGKLVLAKVNGKDILSGSRIDQNSTVELNPILEKYFYTDILLSNNLRFCLTGSEIAHPDKSKVNLQSEFAHSGITINNAPKELVETNSNGKKVLTDDLIKVSKLINNSTVVIDNKTKSLLNNIYEKCLRKIEATAQGTQFKRNVIIPATLQYEQMGVLNGISSKLKVAIIKDIKAKAWNYRGDKSKIDSQDGSAYLCPFESVLENKALQDQEVGVDKKPIWHHYNAKTMSTTLLKFATFTITNERMRDSLDGDSELYNLFKKMTDLKWQNPDGTWNFRNPGISPEKFNEKLSDFNLINTIGFKANRYSQLDFVKSILQGKELFYREDRSNHKQICDFGYDSEKGCYYTDEKLVTNLGIPFGDVPIVRYYHKFDENSNHYKFTEDQEIPEGLSNINSLFQLFNTLGGIYSESLVDGQLAYSDQSVYATVNFMNNISIRINDNSNDLSQKSYYQPLKEMMIAYVANSSAVKVGASNVNKQEAWSNQEALNFMELDADGLGVQMDADHEIDDAEMTEFTQVISALASGGRLHDVANDVYSSLGKLALQAASIEKEAVDNFINTATKLTVEDKDKYEKQLETLKSAIYDIIGRIVINNYNPNNERVDLAKPIIDKISNFFNIYDDHTLAPLKLAFSDPNLYSTILSSFMSNLNKKSIKRKYPGSGCVMAPSYGMIQVHKVNGVSYQYDDLIREATKINRKDKFFRKYDSSKEDIVNYNKQLVREYLQRLQNEEYQNNAQLDLSSFIPTDIVDVLIKQDDQLVKIGELNFDDIDTYYKCKSPNSKFLYEYLKINEDTPLLFAQNITSARNLAPARITWTQDGKSMNIFDTEEVANSFGYTTKNYLGEFNIENIDRSIYDVRIEEKEPRRDEFGQERGLTRRVLHIGLKGKNIGEFTLVADTPIDDDTKFTGTYSVHFKTATEAHPDKDGKIEISTPQERQLLYDAIYEALPVGAEISTWGRLTEGGVKAIRNFGKRFIESGKRTVFYKDGTPVEIGIYRKALKDRKAIQKVFDDLDKGMYNGRKIYNFQNKEAELIMSNLYASTFGLRNDVSLQEILEKGSNAFKIQKLPTINVSNFEMCFTTNTNDNLYFTFKNLHGSGLYAPKKRNWKVKPEETKDDGKTYGKVYCINKQGEKQFQVGAYIERNDIVYDNDGHVFRSIENGELVDTKSHTYKVGKNGQVLEYFEYITCYDVAEKCGNELIVRQIYKINKDAVAKSLKPRESEETVSGKDINAKLGEILATIYSNGSYNGIRLNEKFSTKSAQQLEPILDVMSRNVNKRTRELLIETKKYLSEDVHKFEGSTYVIDKRDEGTGLTYSQFLLNYYNSIADERFASFLKSLTFTSSRIPAQTLQSFMKMRLAGFTSSSKNICYVSHWQTYLQGSDYDIDKAYIMGFSFDENGKYIGWSDLFDYSSIETIEASENLPIPNQKIKYIKNDAGIDITNHIQNINQTDTKAKKIIEYAKLLRYLDKFITENSKNIYLKWDNSIISDELGREVLSDLNLHSSTRLNGEKLEQAMKNSVSSHIQQIIQSPRNMDQAYTSIDGEMSRIRRAAEISPKGIKSSTMTMLNPLTKYLMQVTNMVGKGVIGITATGEKVFFNLTNYWNEGIRSGDPDWINNMKFQRTFTRISGRSKGTPKIKTCTTLANVNFENYEQMRLAFIDASAIDSDLREKYGITDSDIRLKNNKWEVYQKELIEEVKQLQETDQYVDLNISALLSAATDNAKELILDKINAGLNLAKCYIYLMVLGFSIDDIAKFMTSPAVSLISELSDSNMFDEYLPKLYVQDAINVLKGYFDLDKFFPGASQNQEYDGESGEIYSKTEKASDSAFYKLTDKNNQLTKKLEELALKEIQKKQSTDISKYAFCQQIIVTKFELLKLLEKYGNNSLIYETIENDKDVKYQVIIPRRYNNKRYKNKIVQDYFYAREAGLITESLNELVLTSSKVFSKINNNISALSDYIDMLVSKIQSFNNLDEFEKDLEEFEKVNELAEETSILGSRLLKLNQGLPTSEYDLVTLMLRLQNAFDSRLEKFNFKVNKKEDEEKLLNKLKENNPLLDFETIIEGYEIGKKFNLIENFDIEKWLYDEEYRKATSKFYNIIKGTWNIFDVIDKLPHYSSIFKLLAMSVQMNNNLSKKSHAIWAAVKNMYKGKVSIDDKEFNNLVKYIDGLLIVDFVNKSGLTFPIFKDEEYFHDNFERGISTQKKSLISIDNESNRATFKLRFEEMIKNLKEGTYKDIRQNEVVIIEDENLRNNDFIKNLVDDITQQGVTIYKLNLDMQQISATPYNSKKYQDCLNGFIKLKNYEFNGRPLTDWFMLYNLLVNQNMWGSDRLTSLFGPFLNILDNENSLIKEYFKFVGEQDWENFTLNNYDILKHINFNYQDAWFATARIVSENQELYETAHTIKQYKNGMMIIKEKNKFDTEYHQVKLLNSLISSQNSKEAELIRQSDYMNYSTIQTPFYNKINSRILNIYNANTIKSLETAIFDLVRDGIITISKDNC